MHKPIHFLTCTIPFCLLLSLVLSPFAVQAQTGRPAAAPLTQSAVQAFFDLSLIHI